MKGIRARPPFLFTQNKLEKKKKKERKLPKGSETLFLPGQLRTPLQHSEFPASPQWS